MPKQENPIFEIDSNTLSSALKLIGGVVSRSQTIPILSHALIKLTGDCCQITVSDLEVEASIIIDDVIIHKECTLAIPLGILDAMMARLAKGSTVGFSSSEKSHVVIKSGAASVTALVADGDDFPARGADDTLCRFAIDVGTLQRAIKSVSFCASKDQARYILNGVFIHATEGGGEISFVATDGHRLGIFSVTRPESLANLDGITIPLKTIEIITRALKGAKDKKEMINIEVCRNSINVTLPNKTRILSSLIDSDFPDYTQVIPSGEENEWKFDPQSMAEALNIASVVHDRDGNRVTLDWKEASATVSATSLTRGDAIQDVGCIRIKGQDVLSKFNCKYLMEMMGHLESETIISMDKNGAKAKLSLSEGRLGESLAYVLMGMMG